MWAQGLCSTKGTRHDMPQSLACGKWRGRGPSALGGNMGVPWLKVSKLRTPFHPHKQQTPPTKQTNKGVLRCLGKAYIYIYIYFWLQHIFAKLNLLLLQTEEQQTFLQTSTQVSSNQVLLQLCPLAKGAEIRRNSQLKDWAGRLRKSALQLISLLFFLVYLIFLCLCIWFFI